MKHSLLSKFLLIHLLSIAIINKRKGRNKNVLVGKILKINKRTGTTIPDNRVRGFYSKNVFSVLFNDTFCQILSKFTIHHCTKFRKIAPILGNFLFESGL